MNKEQQRIKIAEACGSNKSQWIELKGGIVFGMSANTPDYLNDLNACDGLINHMQTIGFDCVLIAEGFLRCCTFIDQERDIEFKVISSRFTYSICEAFLKTLGLWEEES